MESKESDPSRGYLPQQDTEVKLPSPTHVKNNQHLIRQAWECEEAEVHPPDPTELADYRFRKVKEYEDAIRSDRRAINVWYEYAFWEETQNDFQSVRSIWERALLVYYSIPSVWLKYAEVEMRNNFINHARNVLDRAVTFLPRVDKLWHQYIHMEENLGNVAAARQIFERWMRQMPDPQGWLSYIEFELKYNEIKRARGVFERFVRCHPNVDAWIRFAKFEMNNGEITRSRNVYERAIEKLADDEGAETLFLAFAEFEGMCKQTERARCI